MLDEPIIRIGSLAIAFLGLITTLAINRSKFKSPRLKVEILNDAILANYRVNQILDLQISLRIQSINGKICLRRIQLVSRKNLFDWKYLETFEKAVNIRGDLTKYNEDDFRIFLACILLEYQCSRIIENESRFKEFIQLNNFILEQDYPRPVTLLSRIYDWQRESQLFLRFEYDSNGSRRKLIKQINLKA